jgi:hypothetical protein
MQVGSLPSDTPTAAVRRGRAQSLPLVAEGAGWQVLSAERSGPAGDAVGEPAQAQAGGLAAGSFLGPQVHDFGLVAHEVDGIAVSETDLAIQCLDL